MVPRKLPDLKAESIATLPPVISRYISRIPFLLGCIGSTGSGKTYLALAMLTMLKKEGNLTKLYVICPTVKSNVLYESVLDRDKDWVFEDVSKCYEALQLIERDCEAQSDLYRQALEYEIGFRAFKTGEPVSAHQENLLEQHGWRYKAAVRPRPCLLVDDCSHSLLFSKSQKNPLTNMVRAFADRMTLSDLKITNDSF